MTRNLYVVLFRASKCEQRRELSAFDRLAGWRDETHDCQRVLAYRADGFRYEAVVDEGHERGSLHTLRAKHVLTWGPAPGDTVLAVIGIEFYKDGACYCPILHPDAGSPYQLVCETVLGRAVMLGEDGAEDAFGQDALRQTVQAAVDGDWRSQLCECTLRTIGEDEEIPDVVHVRCSKTEESA